MELLHLLLAIIVLSTAESARILTVLPYKAKSHFAMYGRYFKALAARGHKIDVVGHYPLSKPVSNYKDYSVDGSVPEWDDGVTMDMVVEWNIFNIAQEMWYENLDACERVMNTTVMKNILKSEEKYDLFISEIFASDCVVGFAHKFKIPLISVISSIALPWANDRVGNPDSPAYISNYFLPFTDKMSLAERVVNTVYNLAVKWGNYFICDKYTNQIARNFFGKDLPPVWDLVKNTSLILVNSHFSINQPRPLVPAFVEVGGLHIEEPKPLPKDIEAFLNESEDGVIYFSLGTMVQVESFAPEKLRALLDVFAELPQRVLLKCADNAIPGLPSNVKTAKWLPQLDVLSHPKVKVFVTHGGLMGTQEAVHSGVPMIGIPMFSDQRLNLENYVSKGIAILMEYHTINKQTVAAAFQAVLHNPSYRENAQRLSRLFRDRPQSALETAVYWTEYVIRHGGAPHLRSAAVDMPLYQYLLFDVIAVTILSSFLTIGTIFLALNTIIRYYRSEKKRLIDFPARSSKEKYS
ncbi:UDP-glycosyltransferase UGT5 [Anabrus simplex]|uniref:UDP-glycosyltransferase UGT5 n=1 Tax=Anabrus simplex TaxID=316456 RepID=UPI0035A2C413